MSCPSVTGALSAVDESVFLGVGGHGTVGAQLSGAFLATVAFECSVDGVAYHALNLLTPNGGSSVTEATAPGVWVGSVSGLSFVRLRARSFTSGPITVSVQAGQSSVGSMALTPRLMPASGSVSSAGNNACVTPASGKRLRVYYAAYNNSGAVEAAFRFGASGPLFLRNNLVMAGSIIMKEFGTKYVEGGIDEPLYLNLSGAVATIWNAFYVEV